MRTNRKNLSPNELDFLKMVDDNEILSFNFNEIISIKGYRKAELQDILTRLKDKEFLYRIKKSEYVVRNFRNPYVIANALAKSSAVAYWSALNLHGLTEQIPNVVYVQSSLRKNDKKVFGVRYKFIKVKPGKLCGHIKSGYGNEAFYMTDVEKTLLDCFDLPQYSGGYEELIRALFSAKPSSTKLLEYGKQMDNLSVLKRIAYLSELFNLNNLGHFRSGVLKIVNQRYSLLDPLGSDEGIFNSKWRIRVNIPEQKLLSIINKMY